MGKANINRYENQGKEPTLAFALKILRVLEIDPSSVTLLTNEYCEDLKNKRLNRFQTLESRRAVVGFTNRLRCARTVLGLSQEQAAKACGIPWRTYVRYERTEYLEEPKRTGRQRATVRKLKLGLNFDELFGEILPELTKKVAKTSQNSTLDQNQPVVLTAGLI